MEICSHEARRKPSPAPFIALLRGILVAGGDLNPRPLGCGSQIRGGDRGGRERLEGGKDGGVGVAVERGDRIVGGRVVSWVLAGADFGATNGKGHRALPCGLYGCGGAKAPRRRQAPWLRPADGSNPLNATSAKEKGPRR